MPINTITETAPVDDNGNLVYPQFFARDLDNAQEWSIDKRVHRVLLNKGNYFETSIYDVKIREEVSDLIGVPVEFDNMIAASWRKLEDFICAMNCLDIFVEIEVDWI